MSQALARASNNAVIRNHYDEVMTPIEVHLARAQQLTNLGHFDQAAGECDAALRQDSNSERAKTMRAGISREAAARHIASANQLFERQQYDPALSECDAALRYDPQNADAVNLKAKIVQVKKALGYQ